MSFFLYISSLTCHRLSSSINSTKPSPPVWQPCCPLTSRTAWNSTSLLDLKSLLGKKRKKLAFLSGYDVKSPQSYHSRARDTASTRQMFMLIQWHENFVHILVRVNCLSVSELNLHPPALLFAASATTYNIYTQAHTYIHTHSVQVGGWWWEFCSWWRDCSWKALKYVVRSSFHNKVITGWSLEHNEDTGV